MAQVATATPPTGPAGKSSNGSQCRCRQGCGLGQLMRKLRKQSRLLCMTSRPSTFHCQYDPLSYARNFDRNGFGLDDEPTQFYHSFSSRFVASNPAMSSGLSSNH
ncbi:hypothetical protein LUZ61_011995 [Rhynchospora tenuis]|uniref:Uncharacterized protein n=1 Tax=Rhynchospora tenuis TaxID=198213 RepID=A0AAD6A282_9POAL|nr:hypothetical protein LUZ61_011995 [Rhynchospora tenuis]